MTQSLGVLFVLCGASSLVLAVGAYVCDRCWPATWERFADWLAR